MVFFTPYIIKGASETTMTFGADVDQNVVAALVNTDDAKLAIAEGLAQGTLMKVTCSQAFRTGTESLRGPCLT